MDITWFGQSCFRLRFKAATIITDPYNGDIGLKLPKQKADIVTVSHDHPDHSNLKAVSSDALVLVDEAYFEFSRHTMRPHMTRYPNLVILRTFSKAFSMAGMRVGYLLGHEDVIRELKKVRQPYSVDAFSQLVARITFRERVAFEQRISDIIAERERVYRALASIDGVEAFPSEANFILFAVDGASRVFEGLRHRGILIKQLHGSHPLLAQCLRVTVGTPEENSRFLDALKETIRAL